MSRAEVPGPLDAANAFLATIRPGSRILVALSGGGDSVGLLIALKKALDESGGTHSLCAATIDHRLRAASTAEAKAMARLCEARCIPHLTLAWDDPKPDKGLSDAARQARYRLLVQALDRFEAHLIVTAHTLEDQMETVEMRRNRAAQFNRGLSGIAPSTLFYGKAWAFRPFLNVSRGSIREFLRGEAVTWFEDPSNDNIAFERVRIRKAGAFALSEEAIVEVAAKRRAVSAASAKIVREHVTMPVPLLFRVEAGQDAGDEALGLAVAALMGVAGGTPFLPAEPAVTRLLHYLGNHARHASASLNRTVVTKRRDVLFITRDGRNIPPAVSAGGTREVIWDGRFRICSGEGKTIGGADAGLDVGAVPPVVLKRALSTLPGTAVEHAIFYQPVLAPYEVVLPDFDLELVQAIRTVMRLPPVPDRPIV